MSTGKRLAGVLLLSTALSFPATGFAQDVIGVPPGDDPSTESAEIQQAEDALGPGAEVLEDSDQPVDDTYSEPDISVPGGDIIVTGRRVRDVTRSSTQVVNVLSAEQIARTGEGDIAGALNRVTGLSLVGDGRVYVRGLGDRYSLAMLNGLPLPSPEPLSRVVPLDIFPTNVIASSLVQKTYSANFPGEFGGGVINLTTRAVPDESFFTLSVSGGGDTRTTGRDGLSYFGSDIDWTGFDNGNRDVPSNLEAFYQSGERIENAGIATQEGIAAQIFPTNLATVQKIGNLPPNWSASATGGTSFDVGSDAVLGVIATAGLKNSWRNRLVTSQTGTTNLDLRDDTRNFITDQRMLFNALVAVGMDFGEHTIRWTNLYIRDTRKQASLANTYQFEDNFDVVTQNTAWYERQLMDSQVVGEFEFGPLSLDLRGGYARTNREAPYNLTFNYVRTNLDTPTGDYYVANVTGNQIQNVDPITSVFEDLQEELWFGGIDASYEIMPNLVSTIGYAYSDTDRYSERREFQLQMSVDPDQVANGLTNQVLTAVGLRRPGDIVNGASLAGFNVGLVEPSQSPAFDAALQVHAGYGQLRWLPLDTLTVDVGVRYENGKQNVSLAPVFNDIDPTGTVTNIEEDYFLPTATVTFEASDDLQLRLSGSKTIGRPQFRELIEQTYYDPETNRQFRGNPFLTDSELLNAEARAEYYIGGGDRISVAGFYKEIDEPIEAVTNITSGGGRITSFINVPKAKLYGAEFEAQYSYDLFDVGGWFETKQLMLIANYTYSKSELSGFDDQTTALFPGSPVTIDSYFDTGDAMTGQSEHVANLQFGLEDMDVLQQFTILLNYASDRVIGYGPQQPPIVEDPGLTVDFVARTEAEFLGQGVELNFQARNIFARDHLEYQDNGTNRLDVNSYKRGASFSIGASMEF